jgi:leucyl-tRNA synthetase
MAREEAEAKARRDENVARYLDGATVRRVVYVPDRLVNFVIA